MARQGFPCHAEIGGDGDELEDFGVLVDQCFIPFLWGLGAQEERPFLGFDVVFFGDDPPDKIPLREIGVIALKLMIVTML